MKLLATILNIWVIIVAVVSLPAGAICFGIFGGIAGLYNLLTVWMGGEFEPGTFRNVGLFGNALIFVNGVVVIAIANSPEFATNTLLMWIIGVSFISSGVVTLFATEQSNIKQ